MCSSPEVDIIEITNSLNNDFPSQVDLLSANEGVTVCDECGDKNGFDSNGDDDSDEHDLKCHKNQKENHPVRVDHL